jgi:GMP synthase-like glutamine amidotransferase
LIDFVRKIGSESQFQHIKLVGICFGHQIISIAMGGECVAGTNGWEVGVYGNECTEEGKKWWGDISGEGRDDRVVSL